MTIHTRWSLFTTFILLTGVIFLLGCNRDPYKSISIYPDHFKITVPFMMGTPGMLINTTLGEGKKQHVFLIDNYSPSWLKTSVVQADSLLLKPSEFKFRTSTGSGKPLEGKVGICDSLVFESVIFTKVPFYIIDSDPNDQSYDGVLGSELMSKGIWKFDFKKNLLTFTSSIDSLPESAICESILATVESNRIMVNVGLSNGLTQRMFVDLGFNGDLLVSQDDSTYLLSKSKFVKGTVKLSTPSDTKIISQLLTFDTVKISNHWFGVSVSTTKSTNDRLIGLQFFRRFSFIIIDFKNRRLLVPKMLS